LFKSKLTTINLEGNQIRFLVVRGGNIHSWLTKKLPLELLNQGQIHDPEKIAGVISDTIKSIKGSRSNVISSVTGQRSVHRIMTIPNIQDKLLDETIQRKTKQEFAIPIEGNDIHWRILARTNSQIILYVLAVPSVIVDQQVEALKKAGIKPKVLDIKTLALQRLVNTQTGIIVNLEAYSLSVIILVNHIPILVRSVPLESGDLTPEAKADLLGQELARTVKYYNESNKQNRLPEDTTVYLTGSMFDTTQLDARLQDSPNLSARFQTRTPYQVKFPNSPYDIPEKFSISTYAVNLGLALKSQ
jgi:type IV pilus assembly protein PilM